MADLTTLWKTLSQLAMKRYIFATNRWTLYLISQNRNAILTHLNMRHSVRNFYTSISLLFLSRKKDIYIYFVLRYTLTCSLNSRSSCDRSYRKIFMMSPSVGTTQDIHVVIFPGRSSARKLSAFLLFPFFSFLIVELIQPILPYNKKIITGKREKHAFFFWCSVKVGNNKSIWHGNYSSSPFISHASWGKR